MNKKNKKWLIPKPDYKLQQKISKRLGISSVLAQLCINRGLDTVEKAKNFMNISPRQINDPLDFPQMEQAVTLIADAIENQEKILIYGDYDVDGITATALLYLYLQQKHACVAYYIPDRLEEGYGLHKEAIMKAHGADYKLIITVDCGIGSKAEVDLANSLGIKVIITDHHTPSAILPKAGAIINPKLANNTYPFLDLAGVGVAWKLAQAVEIGINEGIVNEKKYIQKKTPLKIVLGEYLDLVALGTVADVVPLVGENRVMVAYGLQILNKRPRQGIKALLQVAGLLDKPLGTGHISFMLAPRLNAAGRLAQGRWGVKLLTEKNPGKCLAQAQVLDKKNLERQKIEGEIFQEALKKTEEEMDIDYNPVIVLAAENWHPGVIGIVASRLMEKYYRPVILFSIEGGVAKGSGRSIPQFDLYQGLKKCTGLLIQFGGHKMAAGLKINKNQIDAFRQAINNYARDILQGIEILPILKIDLELPGDGREDRYLLDSENLFPFGFGNPQPVFAYRNLVIKEARGVGNDQAHLKICFQAGDYLLEGIGFYLAQHLNWINTTIGVDVAAALEKNTWQGREKIQLVIKDLQPHIDAPKNL